MKKEQIHAKIRSILNFQAMKTEEIRRFEIYFKITGNLFQIWKTYYSNGITKNFNSTCKKNIKKT